MRLEIDEYYLHIAYIASFRATCKRRKVGAVLVDKQDRLLSIGYNGNPSNHKHCIESPCHGAEFASGHGLDACEAIHAEVNAIGSCLDLRRIHTCYTTLSPCVSCTKSLLATNCKRIVFAEKYPHDSAKELWEKSNRAWIHLPYEELIWKINLERNYERK